MAEYFCSKCHYVGKPRFRKRGNAKVEFMMWAMFPLGIPYTIYRMFGKTKICKECSSDILVDTNTPLGMKLVAASEAEILGKIASGGAASSASQSAMHPLAMTRPDSFNQPAKPSAPTEAQPTPPIPADEIAPSKEEEKPRAHQDPNQW